MGEDRQTPFTRAMAALFKERNGIVTARETYELWVIHEIAPAMRSWFTDVEIEVLQMAMQHFKVWVDGPRNREKEVFEQPRLQALRMWTILAKAAEMAAADPDGEHLVLIDRGFDQPMRPT